MTDRPSERSDAERSDIERSGAGRSDTRIRVRVWQELESETNPYIARGARCHGHDLFELTERRGLADMWFLLFSGELPTAEQADLFERWLILHCCPGPRDPVSRSAMNAAIMTAHPSAFASIATSVATGAHQGARAVARAMSYLTGAQDRSPEDVAGEFLGDESSRPPQGEAADWLPVPGFGTRFGSVDELATAAAEHLAARPGAGPALAWGMRFARALAPRSAGWRTSGVAAAVLLDLDFSTVAATALWPLIVAPGAVALGLDQVGSSVDDWPFPPLEIVTEVTHD